MKWTWHDVEEIAQDLVSRYPDTNPLMVDLNELEKLVVDLSDFKDDPGAATRPSLVAIQESWYEKFEGG